MKKVLFIISFIAITNLSACLCIGDIVQGFTNATNQILAVLNQAQAEIDGNVNPSLQENIQNIEEQNQILAKIIVAYKKRNEQKKEMIHLLTKLKELQD